MGPQLALNGGRFVPSCRLGANVSCIVPGRTVAVYTFANVGTLRADIVARVRAISSKEVTDLLAASHASCFAARAIHPLRVAHDPSEPIR